MEARSLLDFRRPGDIKVCGEKQPRDFRIKGFYVLVSWPSVIDDFSEIKNDGSNCGLSNYYFSRRLYEGEGGVRETETTGNKQGECTVEYSNVQPHIWDGTKRHYYLFGRFAEFSNGKTMFVTLVYETKEQDWKVLGDLVKRSAKSFEVDWDKLEAAMESHD